MFPDGNRTRFFPFKRDALALLSYRCDNRSASARPKTTTDKRRDGNPAIWRLGRDLNPLAVSRLPITQTQRPVGRCLRTTNMMDKWRDRSEALRAGNRSVCTPPTTAYAFAQDGSPSCF
jgi:hypothetical protein